MQADLLNDLPTRLVVPLVTGYALRKPIPVLNPEFEVDHVCLVMLTQQMAGVSQQLLGTKTCTLKELRDHIIAALDLAFIGY